MAIPTREQGDRYASAVAALNAGDWKQAQHLAMYLLREMPQHAGVSFVAGVAAMQLQQMPLAVACLQRAVELNPARADYAAQFARSLAQSSRTREAARMAEKALSLSPADAMTLDTLGVVFNQANDYQRAAQMFRRVSELEPGRASYRFNFATSLVFSGDVEQAEHEIEACLGIDPRYWKAYLTLAQLRRQTKDRNHIARIESMLANAEGNEEAETFLNLALAKEQEDLEEYADAFASLARGKAAGAPRNTDSRRTTRCSMPSNKGLAEPFLGNRVAKGVAPDLSVRHAAYRDHLGRANSVQPSTGRIGRRAAGLRRRAQARFRQPDA